MDKRESSIPYRPLGKQLQDIRTKLNETLADVSGAVEIDVQDLASFELGHNRPSQDVLLLLISHFGIKDDEAVKLWQLAGYNMANVSSANTVKESAQVDSNKSHTPIVFTDVVDVVVNNYGVVMNFMQNSGQKSSQAYVARVGMSREHAKSVLQILQMTLSQTEKDFPRQQPSQFITPDPTNPDSSHS